MAAEEGSSTSARKAALESTKAALTDFPPLLGRSIRRCKSLQGDEKDSNALEFRIMQWNVLADALSSSSPTDNFIKCPSKALMWNHRQHRSLEEILTYSPDIIALEEVDHFKDFYLPALKAVGYSGIFIPKGESPCLKFRNNSGPDGCALFYNDQRFTVKDTKDIILQDSNGTATNQVALLTQLYDKSQGKPLCCVVTHLKAKAGNEELRLAQGKHLLKTVCEFLGSELERTPVVFCGDFNAEPTEPVYRLFESEARLPLKSASVSACGCEPEFTTWKIRPGKEVKHTIDYVWYSGGLRVSGFVSTAFECEVPAGRFPCLQYPSDHLSLVFDFNLV